MFSGLLDIKRPSLPPVIIFLSVLEKATDVVPMPWEGYSSFGWTEALRQSTVLKLSLGNRSYYFRYLSSPETKILLLRLDVRIMFAPRSTFRTNFLNSSSGRGFILSVALAVGKRAI